MHNESLYLTRADEILQAHGLSRTQGRIALLGLLATQNKPVSIALLQRKLVGELDDVSLYRALATFEERGMVVRFDFGHGHAHYELAHDKPHHHHAICNSCGLIEDIPANDPPHLMASALRNAPSFEKFTRHSLEFYGNCRSCAS